jgi:hypothetical protein
MADKKIALELDINIKKGDITLAELNSQFKRVGDTIEEQKEILIEFERELLKLESIRANTDQTNYQRIGELKSKSDSLKESIKDQRLSIKELNGERSRASSAMKDLSKETVSHTKITQAIDKVTGGMATKVTKLYKGFQEGAKGVKAFSMGLSGMKKALISTGIGALVVALGLIVAYWDDIIGLVSGVSSEQKKLLADTEKTRKVNEDNLSITEASEDTLKRQGKTEQEILDIKIKQTAEVIKSTELNLLALKDIEKTQTKASVRNRDILSGTLKGLSIPLAAITSAFDYITGSNLAKGFDIAAEFVFNPDEVKATGEAAIKETETKLISLKNKEAKFKNKKDDDNKKAATQAKRTKEKEADEAERLEKKKVAALEAIRVGEIDTEDERRQEELDKVDKHYQELIEAAEKYGKSTEELEEAREAKKQEIFDKQVERDEAEAKKKADDLLKEQEDILKQYQYKQETEEINFEAEREEVARRQALLLEDTTLTNEQRKKLEENLSAEIKAIDKKEADARVELNAQRVDLALNTLGALNGLVQAFAKDDEESQKKAFNANKAFGIAQAIISTAQGISTQLASPKDVLTGANFLKAGIIAATGAAQIATISKTQFKGGGSPPPSVTQPSFSDNAGAFPRGFTSPRVDTGQSTTKVIVTETDIRSVTGNVSGIYNRAVVVE